MKKMDDDLAPVLKVWKDGMSNYIQHYTPYQVSQQLMQMATLFSPGQFYYYVMNFHNLSFDFVHSGTKDILGIDANEFSLEKVLSLFSADELLSFKKKEGLVVDFLFRFLKPEQLLFYKVVYFLRIKDTKGKFHNILHQACTLTVSETGRVEHVLGIHTDISHLSMKVNDKVSFISLDGGPSYYNLDPENEIFDPKNSCPTGKLFSILTKRELEIIRWLSRGMSSPEAAEKLNISKHTLMTHRKNILTKTKCTNITELVAKCVVEGLI